MAGSDEKRAWLEKLGVTAFAGGKDGGAAPSGDAETIEMEPLVITADAGAEQAADIEPEAAAPDADQPETIEMEPLTITAGVGGPTPPPAPPQHKGGDQGGGGKAPAASGTSLFFEVGSTSLTASDQKLLAAYAEAYAADPSQPKVQVTGYSSIDGQVAANQKISQARAQAAADYLVAGGVPKENITVVGKGETDAFSKSDAAQNRRVELSPALKAGSGGGDSPPAPASAGATPAATDTDMFFDVDSSTLTASDQKALGEYAKAFLAQPSPPKVQITGFASVDGQADHNQKLSLARAQAAADFLIAQGVAKENITVTGKGETDSFSKSDAAQNRRVTLEPALKGGGAAPPGPAPVPPVPPAPPTPPAPPALVLSSETEATQPSNRKRTKLGVGERVTLKINTGPGSWTVTGGSKLSAATGTKVTFIARSTSGRSKVTVTVGAQTAEIEFTVVQPNSVHMDVVGRLHKANGRPNAGMHTAVFIGPSDVSFQNIELLELEVGASASGYWASRNGVGHGPNPNFGPMNPVVVSGKGTRFAFQDNCTSGFLAAPPNPPISAGRFDWDIPWQFRVGSSGGGTTFATVRQSIVTAADGTTTVSKAGASVTFKLTDGAATYPGAPY